MDALASLPPARRKGGRPTRRSAEEIGRRIMAATRKLFLARGYHATSMEAVAAEAGVSKATLYGRHKDKEALFQALARELLENLVTRSGALPEIARADLPLEIRLAALAEQIALSRGLPEVQALVRATLLESERFPSLGALLCEEGEKLGALRVRTLLASAPEAKGRSDADLLRDAEIFLQLFRPPPPTVPMEEGDLEAHMKSFRADLPYRLAFFLRGFRSAGS